MRPTFSIILFTVLSGAGYGLLFLLGLDLALGAPTILPPLAGAGEAVAMSDPRLASMVALGTGLLLTTAGLLASVAHLGKPLRAWRAFSQWRTSWLSREGIAAVLTSVPAFAIAVLLLAPTQLTWAMRLLGGTLMSCCVLTVFCTARIYGSLPPVRAWSNAFTTPAYLLLGLYSGALWFVALRGAPDRFSPTSATLWVVVGLFALATASALLKRRYWISLDADVPVSAGHATGLDRFGHVQRFEQPSTEENYLTHEMGFVLARKHARKLRAIAFWSILLAPLATLSLGWVIGWPAACLALAIGMTGVFVERWLFFAEARHAVMAYYGR